MLQEFFRKLVSNRIVYRLSVVVCLFIIAVYTQLSIEQFQYLQSQNISNLSVFNELVIPLSGLTLFVLIFLTLIVSSMVIPEIASKNQFSLISQSSTKILTIIFSLWLTIFRLSVWPLLLFLSIVCALLFQTEFDTLRLATLCVGLTIIWLVTTSLFLSLSTHCKHSLTCLLLGIVFVGTMLTIDMLEKFWWQTSYWRGLFSPFLSFRQGQIFWADFASYFTWLALALFWGYWRMINIRGEKSKINLSICFGLLIAIGLVSRIPGSIDLSIDQRNSASAQVDELLKQMAEPLKLTAVIDSESSREEIIRGYELLKKSNNSVSLSFKSRQALGPEFQNAGEFIQFETDGVQQSLAYPLAVDVKLAFESAVLTLLTRKSQWITFIEGHQEASPFGKTTSDISQLYQNLKAAGWPVNVQNLTQYRLQNKTELLVIASSKQPWLPGEMAQVKHYLNSGKNLLLLLDPDTEVPLELTQFLGVNRYPGTIVDWRGFQSGTPHPAVLIVDRFEQHPVTSNLSRLLAFPWAVGLQIDSKALPKRFVVTPLLKSHAGTWNEQNIKAEELSFDKNTEERQQQFNLALSYENSVTKQRIIVIGDSHFLSDSAINNYDNKQFALNVFSWLTGIEPEITTQNKDNFLRPNIIISWFFEWFLTWILPISLLLFSANKLRRKKN